MRKITNTFIMCLILLSLCVISCRRKAGPVEIKLLLLNSENYFHQDISIHGKIKEIGPLNLWFIVEDESGYIQVTTQNIPENISCLKKGQAIIASGQLEQYGVHKYFSLERKLRCLSD